MTEIHFQLIGNVCLNQWQGNERESHAMEYHYLESDFSLTWVQIEAAVPLPRFTQLAPKRMHLQPKS